MNLHIDMEIFIVITSATITIIQERSVQKIKIHGFFDGKRDRGGL